MIEKESYGIIRLRGDRRPPAYKPGPSLLVCISLSFCLHLAINLWLLFSTQRKIQHLYVSTQEPYSNHYQKRVTKIFNTSNQTNDSSVKEILWQEWKDIIHQDLELSTASNKIYVSTLNSGMEQTPRATGCKETAAWERLGGR